MPDILMTRIDNRLVHGQVGVAWTTALQGVNLIVVADDLAAADPLQQSLMAATAKKFRLRHPVLYAGQDHCSHSQGIRQPAHLPGRTQPAECPQAGRGRRSH